MDRFKSVKIELPIVSKSNLNKAIDVLTSIKLTKEQRDNALSINKTMVDA